MAITYEGAGALFENAAAATTQTPAYPASISANDIIVLVVSVSSATAPTNPAGFTSQGTGTAGGSSPAYRVSTKVATGSESGTLTVTTPNVVGKSRMFLLRGVDTSTLLNTAVTQLSSSTAITAYNLPTQTTSVTGCLLFGVVIGNAATGTFTQPTVPAAFTEPTDDNSPLPHLGVAYLIWSGSGATGTVNFVRSASTRGAGILLAFNPASTGVTGTLAATLDNSTLAASATETITGTLATTLGGATLAAAATETISGTLTTTLAGSTLAASAVETMAGTFTATLSGATLVGAGTETITGTFATTLGGATFAASGSTGSGIGGTLATTLAGVTLAATGLETITGTLSTTLGGASLAATAAETVTGTLATTLGGATLSASVTERMTGILAVTLGGATLAASGSVGSTAVTGTLVVTLSGVTFAAAGSGGTVLTAPFSRTYIVTYESRTYDVPAAPTATVTTPPVYDVPAANRTYDVSASTRTAEAGA